MRKVKGLEERCSQLNGSGKNVDTSKLLCHMCILCDSLSNTMKTMQRDRVKNTINQSSWNPKIYSVNPQESRKRETKE